MPPGVPMHAVSPVVARTVAPSTEMILASRERAIRLPLSFAKGDARSGYWSAGVRPRGRGLQSRDLFAERRELLEDALVDGFVLLDRLVEFGDLHAVHR